MAKVMVSLSDDLLARIDARAEAQETSRSGWLALVAERALARATPAEMRAALKRAQAAFAHMEPFDTAAAIRKDRDSHG